MSTDLHADLIEQFAAKRRTDQDDMEKTLFPVVTEAMRTYPAQGWYNQLLAEVARLYTDTYHREGGQGTPSDVDTFVADVRATLDKTTDPDDNTVDRVSTWLATSILNASTMEAEASSGDFVVMEWVTMHDADVRAAHAEAAGQQQPVGEKFRVGGSDLRYPGDPTAPIELWINCRCTLAPVPAGDQFRPSELIRAQEDTMTTTEHESEITAPATALPWHGVLAPEGVWSGDGRQFAPGALQHGDLPLPLTWQKASSAGHDGSVTVAKIEQMGRVGDQMRASGTWLSTPEADEVIGLVAEFGRYGVSVDADSAEFDFQDADDGKVVFTSARIRSASVVAIPAFAEAFISLGNAPADFLPTDDECDPTDPDGDCYDPKTAMPPVTEESGTPAFKDYDAKQRKDAHTVPGTDSYPIEDCADLRNAIQAIGRAKDPEATKRHIKTQKNRLGCPDVEIPEGWALERSEDFGRGPGWITNPEDTRRIHDYWTKPGEPGYAKINWGVPGDFNRCRIEVGEEIGENSPEKMRFLNQICAQWHYDALGWWPGRPTSGATDTFDQEKIEEFVRTTAALGLEVHTLDTDPGPALRLVASGGWCAPSEWFTDPCLDALTPMTITEEGRVFGHLAGWKTCHTAYPGVCVAPPKSASGYAYFLTGAVRTTDGLVPVGQITMDGPHARPGRMRPALAHYDNTCTGVADITVGEDEFGIWFSGALRPNVDEEQQARLLACPLSGDWRQVGDDPDNMEMIAALSVNSQGFPVPRVGIDNGVQVSLVAAGVVEFRSSELDPIVEAVMEEIAVRERRKNRMAELAARIGD